MSILSDIKNLPHKSGVYRFYDKSGNILYIGKAKDLQKRVSSYWQRKSTLSPSKQIMIDLVNKIDYILTDTEKEALLLEANLISTDLPPFNVMLKDDKSWQYIKIDYSLSYPEIYPARRPKHDEKSKIFGPFTSSKDVKNIINLVRKIFPLCLKPNKKKKEKCFNYLIGKCPGVCIGQFPSHKYKKTFLQIENFLEGNYTKIINKLAKEMERLSQKEKYEQAAKIRDEIQAIKNIYQYQKIYLNQNENSDFISWFQEENLLGVNIFKAKAGKIYDIFKTVIEVNSDLKNVLSSFVYQYYNFISSSKSRYIYTLERITTPSFKTLTPKNKTRKDILNMGVLNAKEHLNKYIINKKYKTHIINPLILLRQYLNLPRLPLRIEGYDISHLQGKFCTGSMVVFINSKPDKKMYRIFKIRQSGKDDPRMIKEVLMRRLKYINSKSHTDPSFSHSPDLILIDGGKVQLKYALEAVKAYHLNIPVVSIAKKEEHIYIPSQSKPVIIDRSNPALKLLQQIRDESHRFARSLHHKLSEKHLTKKT